MKKAGFKKLFSLFLPLLCAAFLLGPWALRAQAVTNVQAKLRPDITIIIDGSKRDFFNVNGQQVHPILYEGTTYLPVRAIGELMGKNVDWNQSTKTITLAGERTTTPAAGKLDQNPQVQAISAALRDDFTVIVEGSLRTFQDVNGKVVYPLLYQGSTYLPVRAIAQLMGKTVSWDNATQTATLSQDNDVTDADSFGGAPTPKPAVPTPVPPQPTPTPSARITLEQAKAKALSHAGLTAGQVTFTKAKLDWDDGRWTYEIEFIVGSTGEYEYEINASTGEVLSYDYDGDSSTAPVSPAISQAKAQEIALGKVPGATASQIQKLHLDWDHDHGHGHGVYEVEISCNRKDYELEIDASTGTILSFECEDCDHWGGHHSDSWHHSDHHH